MVATISDKISSVSSGVRPVSTTVSTIRTAGATSLVCADLTGWATAEAIFFVTYKIDGQKNVIAGSQADWKGIVSGSTINGLTLTGGTDNGNATGDIVEILPTAAWAKALAEHILTSHNQNGTLLPSAVTTSLAGTTLPVNTVATTSIIGSSVTPAKLSTGATYLGINHNTGATLTTSYVTYAILTATSIGRLVTIDWSVVVGNGGSGASRTFDVQVLCDGVATTPSTLNFTAPYASAEYPRLTYSYTMSSTPSAGSHTWALQLKASANSAVLLTDNFIKVSELV